MKTPTIRTILMYLDLEGERVAGIASHHDRLYVITDRGRLFEITGLREES